MEVMNRRRRKTSQKRPSVDASLRMRRWAHTSTHQAGGSRWGSSEVEELEDGMVSLLSF